MSLVSLFQLVLAAFGLVARLLRWAFAPSGSPGFSFHPSDLARLAASVLVYGGVFFGFASVVAGDVGHVFALVATALTAGGDVVRRWLSGPAARPTT